MELKTTKEFNVIVNLLESLEENIEKELAKFQQDFSQKYSLDITRDILQYATDFIKMKIIFLVKDCLKEFSWYTIVIDCTEIPLNMMEMEALLRRVQRTIKDKIPQDPTVEDMQIIIKKYLRKVICKIPTKWTIPVVSEFLEIFQENLRQMGIVTN
ncbi:MAG: hypothetical protein ACTSRC_05925 [Candidatus Helarchaeota archaeon]